MNKINDNKVENSDLQMPLTRLRAGQKGKIININGGCGLINKLESLGIIKNRELKKISDQWMKGPILLQHGHSQIALGFQMASKIIVQVTGDNTK